MDGDEKCPSIFFIFKYLNKRFLLIPNIVTKMPTVSIKSYSQYMFKFGKFTNDDTAEF